MHSVAECVSYCHRMHYVTERNLFCDRMYSVTECTSFCHRMHSVTECNLFCHRLHSVTKCYTFCHRMHSANYSIFYILFFFNRISDCLFAVFSVKGCIVGYAQGPTSRLTNLEAYMANYGFVRPTCSWEGRGRGVRKTGRGQNE